MNEVEKIREEVEMVVNRRLNLLNGDYFDLNREVDSFTNEIMDIIDSLQEEPISNDLEEAANSCSSCIYLEEVLSDDDKEVLKERLVNTFKAGAQWQKQQDQSTIELAEDHAMLAGQDKAITKACEWLENYFKGVSSGTVYLEDFKKYLKDSL